MKFESILESIQEHAPKEEIRVVVRVCTSAWEDERGWHTTKSLRILKRYSRGENFLHEDASNLGVSELLAMFDNLYSVADGVYQVIMTNLSHDWETGYLDDWDYTLVPFKDEQPKGITHEPNTTEGRQPRVTSETVVSSSDSH